MASYEKIHSARVAVQYEDRVLLLRRAEGQQVGCWEFPGGGIQPGEPAVIAGHREVQEEAGQDVEMLTMWPLILKPREILTGKHAGRMIVVYGLAALATSDVIELSHEHDEAEWVPLQEFDEFHGVTTDTNRVVQGLGDLLGFRH